MAADQPTPATNDPVADPLPERFENLAKLERWWLRIGVTMLVVFVSIVIFDALRNDTKHSHGATTIKPGELALTPPFDKPGVYANKDGSYDVVAIAFAFGFLPKEDLVVPRGAKVHFKVASLDVVHGFQIPGVSNVNLEVLPGHVTEVTQRFDEVGRHLILCHEYCGSGHHFMVGHIRVLEKGEDLDNPPPLDATDDATTSATGAADSNHGDVHA
jgi:cytochrome c oxidase subunit 2